MNTEHRIQALEQELEILKNQIQVSLLDIQEYLLTNAYPALRSESPPSSATSNATADQRALSMSSVEVHTGGVDRDPKALGGVPAEHFRAPLPVVKPAEPNLAELQRWCVQQIGKMGVDQTQELIRMYAQHGHFSPSTAETLLDFTELYRASNAPTLPSRPAGMIIPAQQATRFKPSKSQPGAANRSEQPAPTAVPQAFKSTNTHEAKGLKKTAQSIVRKTQEIKLPTSQPAQPHLDGAQTNVVLRLIAGIQNAGAGVHWKKKEHG
jgi:hypothetical protein